ncbi:MFS transporter [Saccharothrix australiensis]|uniref:Putative MFS family arabinose efflux permease n=1 Tax=Saccharothrix australiensis TaxID=2072 RepID=A0A495VTS5_9PSEU|nr:MFS transporter [Saccharothrix australiensis]RKT51815.1 putative MFS family arabinose efflux permease [Saccharothrix australiensis]
MTSAGTTTAKHHLGVRRLLATADFRRLFASRLASQWGDGLFQAGLAGAVLFNPERHADPLAVAAGFAVLLLPYSVVGPFAGALLDRWDRRRVLVVANLVRGVFVLLTAAAVGLGLDGVPLYAAALFVTGVSRFAGSGLSASLPHVVAEEHLVEANAFVTTLGALMAVFGAGCAVALRQVFGAGDGGSAWTTAVAVLGSLAAGYLASRFARGALGPDEVDEPRRTATAVARGLLDGGRAAWRTPSVAAALLALLAHRAAFGVSLLLTLLLMRHAFTDVGPLKAGMAGLGEIAVAGGAGILLAGLITDRIVDVLGRRGTVCGALGLAAASQLGLGLPMLLPTTLAASFVLTFAGQVIKLCVDAAVQSDIGDEVRGRVFALYDTLFNATQVGAVAVAAMVVPLDGRSPALIVAATASYVVGIVVFVNWHRISR